MILGFTQQLNNKPTLFPEKVLACMLKELETNDNSNFLDTPDFIYNYGEFAGYHSVDTALEKVEECQPKLHTIREDKNDRWKPGTMIDFFINVRKKNMFRFAPRVPVVSVQKIYIKYWGLKPKIYIDGRNFPLDDAKVEKLYLNDGFESLNDFYNYFNEDFKGKIIHWTDLRY